MSIRRVLTVTAIFIMAYNTGMIVKRRDIPAYNTRSVLLAIKQEYCIGCNLCEKVCPSEAIVFSAENDKAFIFTGLCHQCTICRLVCPKNTILLTRQNKFLDLQIYQQFTNKTL